MRFLCIVAVLWTLPVCAQTEFFETKIRPVLATKCYACHSTKLKSPMGGLTLDTREGTHRAVEGKLLAALRYSDPNLQMPPGGKLPDTVIADFERWIADGAKDPREDAPASRRNRRVSISRRGAQWWAFQPVKEMRRAEYGVGAPQDRRLHTRRTREEWAVAVTRGRRTHADSPRDARPGGHRTQLRRSRSLHERLVRAAHRPAARVAAVRRALGPLLAGRRSLRRGQSHRRGHQSRVSAARGATAIG